MFDASTSELIRQAPPLRDVNPATLPQELTRVYAELVVLRLRSLSPVADVEQRTRLERLKRIADVYEASVDAVSESDARRASAFVAATSHQILARVTLDGYGQERGLLEADSIHPTIASPLLFLVAEQNADAREAASALRGVRLSNILRSAVVESIYDLASERYEEILERAIRLSGARVLADSDWNTSAADALYGLCWSGIVQLVAQLLGRPMPELEFLTFPTPQDAFDQVVMLATEELLVEVPGAALISTFAGPRHLARLLRHLANDLTAAGILMIPPPTGADPGFWSRWLRHRAKTKPVLWNNHRDALSTGILEAGRSTVLVLPTGAGKTTLSELKIAAALARSLKVVFLVPTLALVDQLRDELEENFPKELGGIQVSGDGDLTALIIGPIVQTIEVMTPERCLALLSHAPDALQSVGLIVFDECHLLSPTGGGKRSLDAMLCLLQAIKRAPHADLLLLSAMLTNAEEFAAWVQSSIGRPCSAYHNPWKPSRQARGVVTYKRQDLGPTSTLLTRPYALFGLHQNWLPTAPADLRLVQLIEENVQLNRGQRNRPTPNANGVANSIAVRSAKAGLKTIVFVQQAGYAPTNADKIAEALEAPATLTAQESVLWAAISAELGGAQYSLVQPTLAALPHNGDMIPQERRLAESMFKRDGGAQVIVATPTLAQGMNLPAQVAILAGDKRQDEDGRTDLEAHEILNAAGRAGRAGHLANGVVLLIPDPIVGFSPSGRPEQRAFDKLRSILPTSDQCVPMDDPVGPILDLIQTGIAADPTVRYFVSRVRAGETAEHATQKAIEVVQRSFAAYKAKQADEEAIFGQKVDALKLLLDQATTDATVATIAASTGMADQPLLVIQQRFQANITAIPASIPAWVDWIVDFFVSDTMSFEALLGNDTSTVTYVVRGKKTGGDLTPAEFSRLKAGLQAWISGRPFNEIELALGAAAARVKRCPRARDLVLKVANRSLYLIGAAIVEVAKGVYAAASLQPPQPAVLDTLAFALRKGLDTPDKIAFAHRRPTIRSRVLIHRSFAQELGTPAPLAGETFEAVLSQTTARLAFSSLA